MICMRHTASSSWTKHFLTKGLLTYNTKERFKGVLEIKNQWWEDKAASLQNSPATHNTKALLDGLKAIYDPRVNGSNPVFQSNCSTLLTDKDDLLARWAEHFNSLLNKQLLSQTLHSHHNNPY